MENSGERKKRKMGNEEGKDGDGEEGEEEKVEKFFALIRSTREMRDRLRNVPLPNTGIGSKDQQEEEDDQLQKKKLMQQEDKSVAAAAAAAAVWNPKFQPEDFMQQQQDISKSKINIDFMQQQQQDISKSKINIPLLVNDAPAAAAAVAFAGPSSSAREQGKETKQEGEDSGLDLKLSL